MQNLDLLIPQATTDTDDWWSWATVTSIDPIQVHLDGDEEPIGAVPDTLVGTLKVDQRVWVQVYNRRLLIVGIAGAPPVATTDDLEEFRTSLNEAATAAANAQLVANEARQVGQQAATAAQSASQAAAEAHSIGQGAASAASTAQAKAVLAEDAAYSAARTAADANTAALNAAGIANSKGKVFYSTSAPAGDINSLWIDTTSGANTPKRWNGSAWIAVTDKTATDAASAAAEANTAAKNAVTEAKAAAAAAAAADAKAAAAHSAADAAKTTADQAVSDASSAHTAADSANAAALNAAGIASSKGKVYYQTTAPTADANSLWIDTASGRNTPKRWNGSAWVAVTDKVATDAASAAAAAQSAAQVADNKAATALIDSATAASAAAVADGKAVSAKAAADAAQATANTANTIANTAKTVGEQAKAVGDDALAKVNTATTNINTINGILPSKADTSYVQSRGTDLVANGTGFLGSNFNFSWAQYVGNDAPAGANGSFLTSASSATVTTDEYIPIDPSKNYVLAFNARQTGDPSTANATLLGGYVPYDQFNNPIVPFNFSYFAGTTVALTAPLNVGDTTVKVTSTAGWNNSATQSNKYVIAWSYIDAGGRVWPEHTYSRDSFAYTEIIDSTTIRLAAPWAGRARGIGATVSNGRSGSYYVYLGAVNQAIPTTWTRYVGTIRGVFDGSTGGGSTGPFPQGTAKIRMVWLPNRNTSGTYLSGSRHAIGGVSLSDAAAAQQDASAALAAAVTAQTTANTAATSAAGKTKVIYSSITPTGSGTAVGDTWFQRGADGIVVGVWEWSGAAWAPRTLNHQTISSIDAGKISVGTLDVANRISAQSMTVDKLLIGSSENLIPNGSGEYNGGGGIWNSTQTRWVVDAASPSGAGYFRCPAGTRTMYGAGVKTADGSMLPSTPQWQVEPGAEYYYELWIRADKPNSRLYIEVRNQAFNQAGFCYAIPGEESGSAVGTVNPGSYWLANKIVPTTWMKVSGVFRANADTTSAYVRAIMYNHDNGTELNAQVDIAGFRLQKRATGKLIVDGSITAKQIKAESLTVDLMAANSIGATQIIGQAVVAGKLGANAVIAGNIAADVVTAKEILGESITAAELASNAVTTRVLNSEAVTSDKIMAFSVVAGKIAGEAVVAGNLAARAVVAGNIATEAVTADTIAAQAVVAGKIASQAVTAAEIKSETITAAQIASETIVSRNIKSEAITSDKVAANAIVAGKIHGQAFEGSTFTGGVFTGGIFQTGSSGGRVSLNGSLNRLQVFDAANVNLINVGALATGGHGMEVRLNNAMVPLNLTAFGGWMQFSNQELKLQAWEVVNVPDQKWSPWVEPAWGGDSAQTTINNVGNSVTVHYTAQGYNQYFPDTGTEGNIGGFQMSFRIYRENANGTKSTLALDGTGFNIAGSMIVQNASRSTWNGLDLYTSEWYPTGFLSTALAPGKYRIVPVYRVFDGFVSANNGNRRVGDLLIRNRSVHVIQGQ